MSAVLDVARLQLGAWRWVVFAWLVLALSFAINLVVAGLADTGFVSGGVSILFVFATIMAGQLVGQWWPFAAGLSVTRSRFYRAALLVALLVGVLTSVAVLAMGAVERASGGWGLQLVFFGVSARLVDHPVQQWLLMLAVFLAAWALGMLLAAVQRRYGALGVTGAVSCLVGVPALVATVVTVVDGWGAVARWLAAQPLLLLLLVPAVVLGVGSAAVAWLVLRRAAP